MADMKPLKLGVAYHGNRMPFHAEQDFREMTNHNINLVVHMLSHTDWDRHLHVMKDLVAMSEAEGLETWMDNWGLGGPPGDKSHFLAYYPDSHMYYSDGSMDPVRACLNSPDYRAWVKQWIDAVDFTGCRTIFWDEPQMPTKKASDGRRLYTCTCPRCRRLFAERYGREMPETADDDVNEFRVQTLLDYFSEVTAYSASKGMKNVVCVMLGEHFGISLANIERFCSIDTIDNIGSDPYWVGRPDDPYDYVYRGTKQNLEISRKCGKDHNIWIQAYNNPRGAEEDIVLAAEAAYDAGARTILAWGFYGSQSNDYAAKNAPLVWKKTCDAFERLTAFERDRILEEKRLHYRR